MFHVDADQKYDEPNAWIGQSGGQSRLETELALPPVAKYMVPRLREVDHTIPPTPGLWLQSYRVNRVSACGRLPSSERMVVAVDNNSLNIWDPKYC